MTHFIRLFFAFFLLTLAGCQTIDIRGQFVSDQLIAELNSKKPTKEEVVDMAGTPTYVPDYSENTWYYIQRSMSRKAWFDPKVIEQRIVKVTFANNKVKEAVLMEGEHDEAVKLSSKFTKTPGTEQSGIQKFVKNVGRFNKTTDGTNRGKKKKKK